MFFPGFISALPSIPDVSAVHLALGIRRSFADRIIGGLWLKVFP